MKKTNNVNRNRKRGVLFAILVVAIMAGTFVVRAGYLPDSVAAIIGISQQPSLVVTADSKMANNITTYDAQTSPVPISTLGVFNVSAKSSGGSPIYLTSVPIRIEHSSANGAIRTTIFSLVYQYCLPIGTTPSYGYTQKYGYSAGNCYQTQVIPYSAVRNGNNGWNLIFKPGWPINPQAISNTLIVKGAVMYQKAPVNNVNRVRASWSPQNAGAAIADVCSIKQVPGYGYGYGNYSYSYGYHPTTIKTTCDTVIAKVRAAAGIGKWLTLPAYTAPKI